MPTLVDEDVVQAFRADGLHIPLGEGAGHPGQIHQPSGNGQEAIHEAES
jgi:hypothetical protein